MQCPGFWVTSDIEGKGVALNACKKVIEYGKSIGINTFEIHTATNNTRAKCLAQKLNFRQAPKIVKSAEIINSKSIDHRVYILDLENSSCDDTSCSSFT